MESINQPGAGVACLAIGESQERLMARADKALYEAKSNGRQRTCVAPAPADAQTESLQASRHRPEGLPA